MSSGMNSKLKLNKETLNILTQKQKEGVDGGVVKPTATGSTCVNPTHMNTRTPCCCG